MFGFVSRSLSNRVVFHMVRHFFGVFGESRAKMLVTDFTCFWLLASEHIRKIHLNNNNLHDAVYQCFNPESRIDSLLVGIQVVLEYTMLHIPFWLLFDSTIAQVSSSITMQSSPTSNKPFFKAPPDSSKIYLSKFNFHTI